MTEKNEFDAPGHYNAPEAEAWAAGYNAARLSTVEECALVAEAQKQEFLSPQYAVNQPFGSLCERFACDEVANAIRALAVSRPDRKCK